MHNRRELLQKKRELHNALCSSARTDIEKKDIRIELNKLAHALTRLWVEEHVCLTPDIPLTIEYGGQTLYLVSSIQGEQRYVNAEHILYTPDYSVNAQERAAVLFQRVLNSYLPIKPKTHKQVLSDAHDVYDAQKAEAQEHEENDRYKVE